MDITKSTEPKSDQQNYDDYIGGPKTVTVSEVKAGSAEQPVEIHLVEYPGRPYKPAKSMRRVLVACWGSDASAYVGRRLTLFGDPTIRFGKEAVGGIRISHLSHIAEPVTVSLTVTRGKRAPFTVQPIVEADDSGDYAVALESAQSLEELQVAWKSAVERGYGKLLAPVKDARKAELSPEVSS
jgi:hypothetical protein